MRAPLTSVRLAVRLEYKSLVHKNSVILVLFPAKIKKEQQHHLSLLFLTYVPHDKVERRHTRCTSCPLNTIPERFGG